MKLASIYKIESKIDGKVYVGSTVNFKNRYKHHRTQLRANRHHSRHLQFAWNKYGEDNFWFEIIDECDSKDRVITEQYWMNSYNSYNQERGYNINPTAESCLGRVHTEETKAKMSQSQKGKIFSEEHRRRISEAQIGKTYSDDYKKKMSEVTKGKVVSKETREKLAAAFKGKTRSQEFRDKMKRSCIGRVISEETRSKISAALSGRVRDEETIQKVANARRGVKNTDEARLNISKSRGGKPFVISNGFESRELEILQDVVKYGLDPSNVRKCLTGKLKSTGGYTCKYKETP
jgi:group I intron endonuclease